MTNLCAPKCQGMGLLDLMLGLIIASLLMAVAVPAYDKFVDRAKAARAVGDIRSIALLIERFGVRNNNRIPNSLNELPMTVPADPWGSAYQYLNIGSADPGNGAFSGLGEDC